MSVGDVVLLRDKNASRNQWRLGRVASTTPSSDGLVRRVGVALVEPSGKPHHLERGTHDLVILLAAKEGVNSGPPSGGSVLAVTTAKPAQTSPSPCAS
jgi:hypothetical protein